MKAILESIQKGECEYLTSQIISNPELATMKTEQGISLLQFAAYCKNHQAVEILKNHFSELSLQESASIGDEDGIKAFLSKNPESIDLFSADGFTALGLAAYFGHFEIVKVLLRHGADPNIPSNNSFQVTPLHSACAISHYEIAKLLIQNKADVNAKQQKGVTPLHSAAHNGHRDLVRLLIENGADPYAKMDDGKSPLDMARENGFADLFENLG